MPACFQKSTNKMLEWQSDASPGTLIANAVRAGYLEADLEERPTTLAEARALAAASENPRIVADRQDVAAVGADQTIIDTMNLTVADIMAAVDSAFPGMTVGQRNIIKRIAVLAAIGARTELRARGVFSLRS